VAAFASAPSLWSGKAKSAEDEGAEQENEWEKHIAHDATTTSSNLIALVYLPCANLCQFRWYPSRNIAS